MLLNPTKILPCFLFPIRYSLLVEFSKLPRLFWKMLADIHVWLPMQLEKPNSTLNCMCMVRVSLWLSLACVYACVWVHAGGCTYVYEHTYVGLRSPAIVISDVPSTLRFFFLVFWFFFWEFNTLVLHSHQYIPPSPTSNSFHILYLVELLCTSYCRFPKLP